MNAICSKGNQTLFAAVRMAFGTSCEAEKKKEIPETYYSAKYVRK
jgi:hypothetical protein